MSEERFPFPVRDAERIMRRRRRQVLRRQAPAPESDSISDGIESGESSDDESSSSGASVQPQTQPPPPSTSPISSAPVIPTLTAILPPAQATLLTSSSGRVIPTLTAILPPAQATLLTSVSSSTSATAAPQNGDTSIQGNRNQPPPTSSSIIPSPTSSPSLLSTSSQSTSTPPAVVLPVGGFTSTSLALTTATTFISSSTSASATTKAPTPANALGETNDAQVSGTPSKDTTLSKGVETVIIVISVGAFFAVMVYVGLVFYRKLRQRKLENTTSFTNGTRSLWGGSEHSASQGTPQMTAMPSNGPLPTYIPPPARQQAPAPESNPFADPDSNPRRSALSNNAAERQERLGRVRADLLAPRELTGGLMRSATQRKGDLLEPNRGHIRSASGNNMGSNATASSGVFPSASAETAWPAGRVDTNTMLPNQRLDIEAGGQWDDSVTVARYSSADTERSMPHWRTPSQWVTDQAKRSQGMSRLPG